MPYSTSNERQLSFLVSTHWYSPFYLQNPLSVRQVSHPTLSLDVFRYDRSRYSSPSPKVAEPEEPLAVLVYMFSPPYGLYRPTLTDIHDSGAILLPTEALYNIGLRGCEIGGWMD